MRKRKEINIGARQRSNQRNKLRRKRIRWYVKYHNNIPGNSLRTMHKKIAYMRYLEEMKEQKQYKTVEASFKDQR